MGAHFSPSLRGRVGVGAYHMETPMTIGTGYTDRTLTEAEIREIVAQAFAAHDMAGKRVLFITPDATRSAPMDVMFRVFYDAIGEQVDAIDYLIALGTHQAMDQEHLNKLFGLTAKERAEKHAKVNIYNHEWDKQETFRQIGTISAQEIEQITDGLMSMDVPVTINTMLWDYDQVIICGPTFPHEVVGFSGGNKYFFPGICGPELLNFFHWLGAVITNPRIIGTLHTPVRQTIDRAAAMLPLDKHALCMVVAGEGLHGLYFDTPERAWAAAADLSSKVHVVYVDRPFDSVLAAAPAMYDDIWTAGKCMYKMECVVADGGELIIHAPHVTEISHTHGRVLDEIGYHTRDYFLAQWEKFKDYPWGVLAHSTHVRGIGSYEDGREKCRIRVTLATGIPEARCRKVNLGYRDPAGIDPAEWQGREDQGRLYVPKAGEMLYKLKDPPAWQRFDG